MRLLHSKRFALVSLAVIWVVARIYAVATVEPLMSPEVQMAKKLLEYGFLSRHGANLPAAEITGLIPNPAAFNYTHHPYPGFWLVTGLYYLAGAWGVVMAAALANLAGCLLLFKTLDLHFGRFPAWLAAVLYALAPCALLENVAYSCVTASALLWPVGAWLLVGRKRADGTTATLSPWGCAALAFVAGQVDWLALLILPALAVLTFTWEKPWWKNIAVAARNPQVRALALGAAASALVFVGQVLVYEADLPALFGWVALKAGAARGEAVSKPGLVALVPIRTAAFVGLPLVLGAFVEILNRRRSRDSLLVSSLVCLVCFGGLVLLLPHYFYMERTIYVSLLAPAAALTAAALQRLGRGFATSLALLCLPGVIYAQMMLSLPDCSPVAIRVAAVFAKHSDIHDIVLTNLKPAEPPFKPSDITSLKAAALLADRRTFYGIERLAQITELPSVLKRTQASLVFIMAKSRPLDADLSAMLKQKAELKAAFEESLPVGPPTVAEKLRAFVWYRVMRKGTEPAIQTGQQNSTAFEIYRLEMGK